MTDDAAQPDAAPPETPYVGLVPFDEEDAAYFFGRDDETRIVAGNLRASDLTLVYGDSGVGKTSLLRAGVVHHLRAELRARPRTLGGRTLFSLCTFAAWRDDPLPLLMEAIRASVVEASGHEVRAWTAGEPPAKALSSWTEHVRTLLVVLDQFEDYFLYHPDEQGAGTFGGELPGIVNDPNLRVHVLLSLREDGLGKLDRFKGHIPRLYANYVRIEHLTRAAARDAVVGPVEEWNRRLAQGEPPWSLEPALVEAVVEAAATGELVLARTSPKADAVAGDRERVEAPFLQLVLERLWRATVAVGSRELTLARLQQLGGARRIVENHLLEALAALDTAERDTAADVFRYLVTRSKTKIAQPASDLAYWVGRPEPEVTAVLDKLTRGESGRILRRVPPPPGGGGATRYELFHDILAEPVLEWRREVEQTRRRRAAIRRFALVGGGLAAIAAVFGALGVWALVQRSEARAATRAATSVALASAARDQLGNRFERSLLLALEAYRAKPTAEATSAMVAALTAARRSGADAVLRTGTRRGVRTIAVDPERGTLAAATFEGPIELFDTTARRRLGALRGHSGEVWSLSFSPVERLLASASYDGTIRLWDPGSRTPLGEPISPGLGRLRSVAFSPDGRTLAVAGDSDDSVRLLDVRTRRLAGRPFLGHEGEVTSVAFSPDGRRLVSGGYDRTVRLWDVRTRALLRTFGSHESPVWSVAFSPDGRTVASGGDDATTRLWDAESGRALAAKTDLTGDVWGVAFSPDGRTLASTGFDETVRLWDARTGEAIGEPLRGHAEGVLGVAFRADGLLVSAGYDGTARLWSRRSGAALGRPLVGHRGRVTSVSYSPDGKLLASGGFDRTIRLWDGATGEARRTLDGTDSIEALAFSPDGRTLASAAYEAVALWAIPSGERLGTLDADAVVEAIAWSPDGQLLASGVSDGRVLVWDAERRQLSGEPVRAPDVEGPVFGVAFRADGALAFGALDGALRIWDLERHVETNRLDVGDIVSIAFAHEGRVLASTDAEKIRLLDGRTLARLGELSGHEDPVEAVALTSDGRLLASASRDETVRVWDVAARRQLGPAFDDHDSDVFSVAFRPDGRAFATGGGDGTVRVWEGIFWRDDQDLAEQVCRLVAPSLTRAEWEELAPGLPYRESCPT